MPTRGNKDPNGRALRGRRAHTTFASSVDPAAQIWSNYNVRSGVAGAETPEQPAVQNCLYDRFEALYKKSSIKPSLVIVPARFKSGTLYSEIPTSGAGDFTVTRASGGVTRVNASGLIESAKTNLVLRSEEFDNASWSKTGLTASTGTTTEFIAPDGNLTAQALTLTLVSGGHTCNQFLRWPSGTLAVGSVYVKPDTATKFFIANGSLGVGVFFNLSNGTIEGTIGAMSGTISAVGNGYYRITAAHTATASQTFQLGIYQTFVSGDYTSTAQFTPSSANLLYVWGAQLEEGSSASEYIPTTTVARTRFAGVTVDGTSPSGIPRLDYFASGGVVGCPALLVEPQAQNVARFVNQMTAQDFPAASGGMTITTGSTDFLAPDGTSGSITKYVGGAASGSNQSAYYVGGPITASAAGVHTFSLFVKAGATNPLNFCAINFALYTGASGTATSYFSLASGTALTSGASIQNYGNGWYRLSTAPYTLAAGDLSGTLSFFMAEGNGDLSWPASGALNLTAYTWGAQLETGSVATSYIPTTTAAVTRNADVINLSGAVSGCIGQTEGTIYAEVDVRNFFPSNARIIALSDGTGANSISLQLLSNAIRVTVNLSSSGQADIIATMSAGVNKIALGYKQNDMILYLNGTSVGTDTTCNIPATNKVDLGNINGGNQLNDRIRAAALYTTRLTNAQLAFITQP